MFNKTTKNSFLRGFSSVLDVWPRTIKNPTAGSTDRERLQADMAKIGADFQKVIGTIENESRKS